MKNIEKFPRTNDALEAWRQSVEGGVYLLFDEWAQREYEAPRAPTLLEAAYKRECEATCKESFNVKAMREALESVRNWCLNRLVNASYQVTVEGLLSVVNEALSAPPRNCDMPLIVDGRAGNVADEAWLAFRRCNLNVYFDVPGLLRCIKWLFDEAKGETNGSK